MDLNLYLIDERVLPFPGPATPRSTLCRRPEITEGSPTPDAEYAARQPPPPGGANAIMVVRTNHTMDQLTQRIWRECGRYRLNMIRICCHGSDIELRFGAGLSTDAHARAFRYIRRMWVRPGFGNLSERLEHARIEVHGCFAGRLFILQNLANHAGVNVFAGTGVFEFEERRVVGVSGQEADPHFAFEGPVRCFKPTPADKVRPEEFSQL